MPMNRPTIRTDHVRATVNALRVAAEVYDNDAASMGDARLRDQFMRQATEARTIAAYLDD